MSLVDRVRASRRGNVKLNGKTFIFRRPTDEDYYFTLIDSEIKITEIIRRFVIDWKGFTELDFDAGGTHGNVEFDSVLFSEWLADQPEIWVPLADAIIGAYNSHNQKRVDAEKKSDAG